MGAIEKTIGQVGSLFGFVGKSLKSFWNKITLSTKDDEDLFSDLEKAGLFSKAQEPRNDTPVRVAKVSLPSSGNAAMLPPNEHIDKVDIQSSTVYKSGGKYYMALNSTPCDESKEYEPIEISKDEYKKVKALPYSNRDSYCISFIENRLHEAWNSAHVQESRVVEETLSLNDKNDLGLEQSVKMKR